MFNVINNERSCKKNCAADAPPAVPHPQLSQSYLAERQRLRAERLSRRIERLLRIGR